MEFGNVVENDVFGEIRKDRYQEAMPDTRSYVNFKQALNGVRKSQWGDPENPRRFFPRDVLQRLRADDELRNQLPNALYRYFTAIHSDLDRHFGIDAFFECLPNSTDESVVIRVTLDVTTNPSKGDYRADITILVPDDGIDPKDEIYPDFLDENVAEIKKKILTKFEEMGNMNAAH